MEEPLPYLIEDVPGSSQPGTAPVSVREERDNEEKKRDCNN